MKFLSRNTDIGVPFKSDLHTKQICENWINYIARTPSFEINHAYFRKKVLTRLIECIFNH